MATAISSLMVWSYTVVHGEIPALFNATSGNTARYNELRALAIESQHSAKYHGAK
jgi:hypothetical protein